MLNEILSEYEKVKEKDISTKSSVRQLIRGIKDDIKKLENDLEFVNNSMTDSNPYELCQQAVNITVKKVSEDDVMKAYNTLCNNFYAGLSKLGKIMAKNMENEQIENFNLYDYDKQLFYTIIAKDLYRRGDFNTADSLIKESGIPFEQNFRFIFKDLNLVTKDLKEKNVETIIEWCNKYKNLLLNIKSSLHFECLKLKFILIFKSKPSQECVEYSKKYFQDYVNDPKYVEQISKIMTLLIFKGNMQNCPYSEFNEDNMWNKITNTFINDCCTILNLPNESGFYLSILTGMIALPQIFKAEKILKCKKEIINEKELPYEIHIPNEVKFHSLFICPVTKEISTLENPPMLLNCGHAVSQNALEKMQKGTSSLNKDQIKCPTCPNTQSIKDAQKLDIF